MLIFKKLYLNLFMPKITENTNPEEIVRTAIDAMVDKKGAEIISLDLRHIPNAVCDYFVICHGTSTVHVEAIAEGVLEKLLHECNERPWHKEGMDHAEWILVDYVNIVVHVFLEEKRRFYNLEDLWADAKKAIIEA